MIHTPEKQKPKVLPSQEKNISLPIPITTTQIVNKTSYHLTNQIIDPINFSPPNLFMNKLKMRMNIYSDYELRNVLIREIA
jgi:hypothetical protein